MATSGGGISTGVSQVTELRLPDKAPQITQLVMAGPRPALGHLPVFDDAEVKVRELSGVKGSQQPHDFPKIVLSVGIGDLGNKARPWMSAWRLSGTHASREAVWGANAGPAARHMLGLPDATAGHGGGRLALPGTRTRGRTWAPWTRGGCSPPTSGLADAVALPVVEKTQLCGLHTN